MATTRPSVACAAAALAVAACGSSGGTPDEELPGLVHAAQEAPPAIDAARAAKEPAMLAAALDMPQHQVTALLGPHTLTARSKVEVQDGAGGPVIESLGDDVILEDGGDTFHGKDDNSADYGREIIAAGGALYLRPRYARWHARAPEDGELVRLRDELGATLAAHFDLLASGVTGVDRGELEVAGRPARRIAIEKAAIKRSSSEPAAPSPSQKKWRENAEVLAAGGEVVLDARTGAPLRAHLEGQLAFTRDGHRFVMKVIVDHEVGAIGTKPAIAPPAIEDTVATPGRLREVDERDLLLEGMAPPARKQPQAAGSGAASGAPPAPPPGATKGAP
jgi:hypothetical protein